MYWALVVFNFFVAISAVATVLGQSPNAYSSPVVLICATVIASVALVMLAVSVFLLQNSRKPKEPTEAATVPDVQGNKARPAGPADERRQIEGG